MMNNYFKLYANCIATKGSSRSIICDLQRMNFEFISNDLLEVLDKFKGKRLKDVYKTYGDENKSVLDSYFAFLETNEYIFFTSNKRLLDQFPAINLTFEKPKHISNIVIDFDFKSPNGNWMYKLFNEGDSLLNEHVQFRVFEYPEFSNNQYTKFIQDLLLNSDTSICRSIELFLPHRPELGIEFYQNLLNWNNRIMAIYVHGSPNREKIDGLTDPIGTKVYFIKEKLENSSVCGLIHPSFFRVNMLLFTEAQQHNTCLNRKISIDVNGEIKNCPSMAKSYGNIKDTTLAEAIEKPGFKDLWFINKDKIHVCKDCEFRYICTDCRAYIENPEDIYSKPLKCGYNPYTAEWEEWSTNPLKQKAIEYYGMQDLVKKTTSA